MIASGSAAAPHSQSFGGGSDVVEVAMLAARAAAAVKRIDRGVAIDSADRKALHEMGKLLAEAASSVAYFGSGGRTGSVPRGSLATRVDTAIEAAFLDNELAANPAGMTDRLQTVASAVAHAASSSPLAEDPNIGQFLEHLSATVLRQTGHVGEVVSAL